MSQPGNRRFLIIANVGDTSLHREWVEPADYKNFDLCLNYYGGDSGRYAGQSDFYFEIPGFKCPSLKHIIAGLGDRIHQYDAIWLPDEDISTNAANINRMFEIFYEQQFALAQPALTHDSYYSFPPTLQRSDYLWRYTNYVEVMAPLFSRFAFQMCLPTFEKSYSGWGVDIVWPKVLGYPYKKIAIIDETPVAHTRPIGGGSLYKKLPRSPWDDLHALEREYEVTIASCYEPHYDGVIRGKKIIFALLAHQNEKALAAQVRNIQRYNPNSAIVLYNGGSDPNFGRSLNIPICPYSRPLQYGKLSRYLLEVMRWLEETNVEYEYLINIDDDVLFVKRGFEAFLERTMNGHDAMGWDFMSSTNRAGEGLTNVQQMRNEWDRWKPVFNADSYFRCFNPGQVYRRGIAKRMLSSVYIPQVERMFDETNVFAMEEIFFVTLAMAVGGRCRPYPRDRKGTRAVRWGREITLKEAVLARKHRYYFWIHPVKDDNLITVNRRLLASDPGAEKKKKKRRTKAGRKKRRLTPRSGRLGVPRKKTRRKRRIAGMKKQRKGALRNKRLTARKTSPKIVRKQIRRINKTNKVIHKNRLRSTPVNKKVNKSAPSPKRKTA